jgi:hypothetical protein
MWMTPMQKLAGAILSVQPIRGTNGQIFRSKMRHSETIVYRYLSSSDQHNFTVHETAMYTEIYKWCVDTFGMGGNFNSSGKQWCMIPKGFAFFTEKDANLFALRWM